MRSMPTSVNSSETRPGGSVSEYCRLSRCGDAAGKDRLVAAGPGQIEMRGAHVATLTVL
jgi:hypothetical protein